MVPDLAPQIISKINNLETPLSRRSVITATLRIHQKEITSLTSFQEFKKQNI